MSERSLPELPGLFGTSVQLPTWCMLQRCLRYRRSHSRSGYIQPLPPARLILQPNCHSTDATTPGRLQSSGLDPAVPKGRHCHSRRRRCRPKEHQARNPVDSDQSNLQIATRLHSSWKQLPRKPIAPLPTDNSACCDALWIDRLNAVQNVATCFHTKEIDSNGRLRNARWLCQKQQACGLAMRS